MIVMLFSTVLCLDLLIFINGFNEESFSINENLLNRVASKDFSFGVASSAYQIEGGWNQDNRGESIWDKYTHEHPERIWGGSTGDVACDSYNNIDRDVKMLTELGVDFYRFSISWSRILPRGFANEINKKGIEYYDTLLNALHAHNITPMVTIYHWDLPQPIQDLGGWANSEIVDLFTEYARVLFDHFADRVPVWTTVNEPYHVCRFGYGTQMYPPDFVSDGIGDYKCMHNIHKAHANVFHLYKSNYEIRFPAKIGLVASCIFFEPKTDDPNDIEAALRANLMNIGWQTYPVYGPQGDYPENMKKAISARSRIEGFSKSRLPTFTPAEIKYIRGTYDYLGLNYYTARLVEASNTSKSKIPSYNNDIGAKDSINFKWKQSGVDWLQVYPLGMKHLLTMVKEWYNNPIVFITENGCGTQDGESNNLDIVDYYESHLKAVYEAILEDGCDVRGYTSWSLMDSFEWDSGYKYQFGLYKTNFSDPKRPTRPKASAKYYQRVIQYAQNVRKMNENEVSYIASHTGLERSMRFLEKSAASNVFFSCFYLVVLYLSTFILNCVYIRSN